MLRQAYTTLLLIVAFIASSKAQFADYRMYNISLSEGLSQSSVYSIFKDSKGYMWFGTLDGLNRWDGNNFKTFFDEPDCQNCLSNDRIIKIFEDSASGLWIINEKGIEKYDMGTNQFFQYKASAKDTSSISNDTLTS